MLIKVRRRKKEVSRIMRGRRMFRRSRRLRVRSRKVHRRSKGNRWYKKGKRIMKVKMLVRLLLIPLIGLMELVAAVRERSNDNAANQY